MAPTNPNQDDYYAQMQSAAKSGADDKKPLKLKLKPIVKKVETTDETPQEGVQSVEEVSTPTEKETPRARLVEREHASE